MLREGDQVVLATEDPVARENWRQILGIKPGNPRQRFPVAADQDTIEVPLKTAAGVK